MKAEIAPYSYNSQPYFKGQNRIKKIAEKLAQRDIYSDTIPEEYKELRKIYNNLWKNMGLPENLKPRLQSKAMLSNMAFSLENYMIYFENRLSPFKMNLRNKTGKNESILRHEIEHTKQIWDIIRLIGADNMPKELRNRVKGIKIEITPSLMRKMREIENTMGRIIPDTEEYTRAQQYLKALRNYPNLNDYYGIGLAEIKKHFRYKHNLLEKNAAKEERKYRPTLAKTLKTTVKEFLKLFKN